MPRVGPQPLNSSEASVACVASECLCSPKHFVAMRSSPHALGSSHSAPRCSWCVFGPAGWQSNNDPPALILAAGQNSYPPHSLGMVVGYQFWWNAPGFKWTMLKLTQTTSKARNSFHFSSRHVEFTSDPSPVCSAPPPATNAAGGDPYRDLIGALPSFPPLRQRRPPSGCTSSFTCISDGLLVLAV